jgi:hypothetical protein
MHSVPKSPLTPKGVKIASRIPAKPLLRAWMRGDGPRSVLSHGVALSFSPWRASHGNVCRYRNILSPVGAMSAGPDGAPTGLKGYWGERVIPRLALRGLDDSARFAGFSLTFNVISTPMPHTLPPPSGTLPDFWGPMDPIGVLKSDSPRERDVDCCQQAESSGTWFIAQLLLARSNSIRSLLPSVPAPFRDS